MTWRPSPTVVSTDASGCEHLRDGYERRSPNRTFVQHYGEARLALDGAPLAGEGRATLASEYVVVENGDSPRIVAEQNGLRFMLHVAARDLMPTATKRVTLLGAPKAAASLDADAGRIVVAPGASVRVLERAAEWVRVKLADETVDAEGWLPASAMGVVYAPLPWHPPVSPTTFVQPDTTMRERSGGRVLATFTRLAPAQIESRRGDVVRIQVKLRVQLEKHSNDQARLHYEIHGWVRAKDLTNNGFIEDSAPGESIEGSAADVSLTPNTCLHLAPRGPVVGMTLAHASASVTERREDWVQLMVQTAWGYLAVWAPATLIAKAAPGAK
ncbi:hypothetical protein LVJ94_24720 [Pendulispora rubella]|uniref:SH3 domain-containing protein n=1 Tax=Pendulispora rubella TaxID=2741070 RepID=A0ABZ2LHJ1_9BACT